MAVNNSNDGQNALGYVLLHIFFGPVFAILALAASVWTTRPPTTSGPFQFNPVLLWEGSHILLGIVMLSWVLGFIPATMHAALTLMLHRLMGTTVVWFLLTPFVGWFVTFVPMVLLGGGDPRTFTDGAHMALVGSVAAIGCLAVAWMCGMYPVRQRS